MKIVSITWSSELPLLLEGAKEMAMDISAWSYTQLSDQADLNRCIQSLEKAQLILLHPSSDPCWDQIIPALDPKIPVISFGRDPSHWTLSSVPLEVTSTVNRYVLFGGPENYKNMLKYACQKALGMDLQAEPPAELLWHGLYHPDSAAPFATLEDYRKWYGQRDRPTVGILFGRNYWTSGDLSMIDSLIREMEHEFDVLAAFCFSMGDSDLGAWSSGEVAERIFKGKVDAVINLQPVFRTHDHGDWIRLLKDLDVPVFHPLVAYHKTHEEWMKDIHGLSSSEVGWSVAMPELAGVIEPIIMGVTDRSVDDGALVERHLPIQERASRIRRRVSAWIALKRKPISERRVAFILHNNPCVSVEASVGGGAHLDTLESVARIMERMARAGYTLEDPPKDGKELIGTIMNRKAVSEFRWTSIEEIVSKGGAIAYLSVDEYRQWFDRLSSEVRSRLCDAWGSPPGEEKDGIPAAMVYQGKIVITGVRYGNALVCAQPKRGCAGSRCDGQVCKILHDPEVPPTHQYLATYRYIEKCFGADVIVHVGTHGNLEFLPGKSVGLSRDCYPDIAIGDMPHLYIYNSDNPPEGTIAKRRSYAALVDHMQTVMTDSDLYGELKDLEDKIAEYNRAKVSEGGRAHVLEHLILELLEKSNLADEMQLEKLIASGGDFEDIVERAHDKISQLYNTQIPDGMHVFGGLPEGKRRQDMVGSILRQEARKAAAKLLGKEVTTRIEDLRELDQLCKEIVFAILQQRDLEEKGENGSDKLMAVLNARGLEANGELSALRLRVHELCWRMDESKEIESLMHGFSGGFIEPGPSGLISKGKIDVLPTGRNFFTLDPSAVPTEAAWEVGGKLADRLIEKHHAEHGRFPENVAMFWMAGDVMYADGEQMAQMFSLIGVRPVWRSGRLQGYRIVPLQELGRPRIDLTVRVSGIIRDCFYNCIETLDQAMKEVAGLDEPPEMNYLRKHDSENGPAHRIFASRPGTYGNGVNLAVYASAWKKEKDLSDVFIFWNGYAYGKGFFGEQAQDQMIRQLRSVDITFNKTTTDEKDLFGCCCYFGNHGGLTMAAREVSGRDVEAYYGDTRDPDHVEVRDLADEVRRVVRSKLLNPKWIEGMKRHGYKGAGDISKRVGRVYGWEATTQEVDDWIFDDIAKTFIMDEEMRRFFEENNPWAMEEMGRRLLEAEQRGLWKADPRVLDALKSLYLEIEGWMEERMGDVGGEFQGGTIDVLNMDDVAAWKKKMAKVLEDHK
ncbi:MAG TPA: cobaltochelatase subunit CobN [Methanotrichaceae archaeon]|nr:cobaltochelatase subunit CobN [Methanotrichaceae archaeon]HQF17173.1 cobaltochelatase subunit CobN [Methanotrichaceae archaeon]HQI91746.1 cobaltochelatase subunit CobN [Methanotrichaceae archaeon]HQJ29053.1 cobaltochelatase subunit CobN [Methanotrichaceae archaeon]